MPKRHELARHPAAGRRAFLRGAAIAGAATLVQVATGGDAAHAATPVLVGDGVTDDAPALQQIFDAGLQPAFVSNRTYLLNSPIFLDRPTSVAMFVMELNGAILKLGPNLPTTDAFYRDTATRWALFPNTKRTALSGGKVNVSVETRATGEGTGALISLVLRNGTVDGNKANVGFAFGNRTGAKFESVILRRGRTLLSWYDYSDANVFLQCHNKAGGPASAVLVEQVSSGDGLLMQSCKADSAVGLARLKYCRGAEIVGTVTGRIELDACSAIQIRGGHQETPIANQTIIDIRSSDVVIDTTALYLARGNADESLPPAIRITDSGSPASSVVLRDCVEMRALVASDERLGNLISIEEAVAGTRFETRGLNAVVSVRGVGGVWSKSIGPSIGGAAPVAAAVAAFAGHRRNRRLQADQPRRRLDRLIDQRGLDIWRHGADGDGGESGRQDVWVVEIARVPLPLPGKALQRETHTGVFLFAVDRSRQRSSEVYRRCQWRRTRAPDLALPGRVDDARWLRGGACGSRDAHPVRHGRKPERLCVAARKHGRPALVTGCAADRHRRHWPAIVRMPRQARWV